MEKGAVNKPSQFLVLLLVCASAGAQGTTNLSQFFEGKQVIVRIDMPGTQQGIDIYPERSGVLDTKAYGKRMKSFPVSLHNGDTVMVTTVKVKDKLIEFQLGGGGFGTAGDDTKTTVDFKPAEKSDREKDLERQLSATDDPDQKQNIQRELDYLKRQRERDDQRNKAIADHASGIKRMQVDEDRAKGGSRFNLRYDGKVPANITPKDVMVALSQYLSFPPELAGNDQSAPEASAPPVNAPAQPTGGTTDAVHGLQKGMRQDQVRALLGNPTSSTDAVHDGLQIHSETYTQEGNIINAQFVNGVLVRYSIDVH